METLVRPGKKAKPGTVIDFGEGLLTGTVIDTVDDGNRLIRFSYKGIFEEIWISWVRCRFLLISPISFRTRTGIRPCMQSMRDRQQHLRQGSILQRSF